MIVNVRSEDKEGIRFHTVPDIPWQYPVITEKSSFLHLLDDPGDICADYLAFPWATIIDKSRLGFSLGELPSIRREENVFTVCQHIHYRSLAPIFKLLGITVCFASHATEEDIANFKKINIEIKPFPLYAVNATVAVEVKDYIYSFIGMSRNQSMLSDVRDRIVNMEHPANSYIKARPGWHYRNRVYKEQGHGDKLTPKEELTESSNRIEYMEVLARSRYSLCPSGTGPNTIRFWESLAAGSIPVVLSDKMLLPEYDWESCILRIEEQSVDTINDVINSIPKTEEEELRAQCLIAYRHFSDANIISPVRCHFEKKQDL